MNVTITTTMKPVNEVKGLSALVTRHLKTKTELTVGFDKEKFANLDLQGDVAQDIVLLGLEADPLTEIMVTVEGVDNFGRLFNRSIPAFSKIGVTLSETQWEAKQGVVTLELKDATGNDLCMIMEVIAQLAIRAMGTVSGTQHPLSLFDMKQALGVVTGAKQGDEASVDLDDWFKMRELTILEEVKAAKKAAKDLEKAKAAAAAPAKPAPAPKVAPKPVTKTTVKEAIKSAVKPLPKKANLSQVSAEANTPN